jgi:hypothetical protein
MLQAISRLPGTTTKEGHKLQVSQDSKAQATLWLPFTTTKQGHTFFIFQFLCFYFFDFILFSVSFAVRWSLQTTDPFWEVV